MTEQNQPLDYIKRTRRYYDALGYGKPYEWASYTHTPFTLLSKQLSQCCVSIVTTAAPFQETQGDQGPGAPYNSDAKFFEVYAMPSHVMPDLRISHVAIDRDHTSAEDIGSYFPLRALQQADTDNKIGRIADRFYGLPTNRSKRTTVDVDCQQLLKLCQHDKIDLALLVPNCPVCHQSVSLAARALESSGIATVILGCAKDIVENVGVPRFLFSDFPLGNSAGMPNNPACQSDTINLALDLATQATQPNTTLQSPYQWNGEPDWKDSYSNPDKLTSFEIEQRRKAFDEAKSTAKSKLKNL